MAIYSLASCASSGVVSKHWDNLRRKSVRVCVMVSHVVCVWSCVKVAKSRRYCSFVVLYTADCLVVLVLCLGGGVSGDGTLTEGQLTTC